MLERRASDALWRELRQALLAAVRENNQRESTPIVVHEGEPLTLRLQKGEYVCDLRASRELVTCQVLAAPAKEVLFEWVIGLRPGTAPSFRMDGQAVHADAVAARLLGAFLVQAR